MQILQILLVSSVSLKDKCCSRSCSRSAALLDAGPQPGCMTESWDSPAKEQEKKKSPVNYLSHLSVLVKWKWQWLLFPYQMLPARNRGHLSAVSLFKVTGGAVCMQILQSTVFLLAPDSFPSPSHKLVEIKAALLCWHCGLSEVEEESKGTNVFAHPSRARKCEMQHRFWWVTWLQRDRCVNYSAIMQL